MTGAAEKQHGNAGMRKADCQEGRALQHSICAERRSLTGSAERRVRRADASSQRAEQSSAAGSERRVACPEGREQCARRAQRAELTKGGCCGSLFGFPPSLPAGYSTGCTKNSLADNTLHLLAALCVEAHVTAQCAATFCFCHWNLHTLLHTLQAINTPR